MKDRLIELLRAEMPTECDKHEDCIGCPYEFDAEGCFKSLAASTADHLLANGVIVPPCKIGDEVWGIRKLNNGQQVKWQAKQGIVYQMYFGEDMRLCVCVKNVCRGEWGVNIFLTREEAERALQEKQKE